MKRLMIIFQALLILGCSTNNYNKDNILPFERRSSINESWKFHLGDLSDVPQGVVNDTSWRTLDLPHDWAVEGPFSSEHASGTGYLPGGIAWYQKQLEIEDFQKDRRYLLMFDGAYQNAETWINGEYLGIRPYGYSSFYYDITDYLNDDSENVITVKLDHTIVSDSRWYTGNGIYRNVWLITTNQVYVDVWGTFVSTPEIVKDKCTTKVETTLKNSAHKEIDLTVFSDVVDLNGLKVNEQSIRLKIGANSDTTLQFTHELINPALWSPETPNMYHSEIRIYETKGDLLDLYETPFGIRDVVFTPDKGFFCNGKSYKLKGVCLHHDYGALGAARLPEAIYPVLKKLKDAGCNAIRTSHNPEDPEYLNMLDTMGFFVMEEAFDEFKRGKKKWIKGRNVGQKLGIHAYPEYYNRNGYSDFYEEWAQLDIQDMVKRDRNHPSIIMWSIGNETDYPNDPYQDPNVKSTFDPSLPPATEIAELVKQLTAWVKEIDTTRAITQALANTPVTNSVGVPELLDVVGYNYQEKYYEQDHKTYPNRVIYGSENDDNPGAWKAVRDNDYISGQFLWTGMDYRGEAGMFKNHSFAGGIIDFCGFEKPDYYFRKSVWTNEPMIKMSITDGNWWNHKMHYNWSEGQAIEVKCYTNCEQAELFVNGVSLGVKDLDPDLLSISWRIDYQSGTISVNGLKDGEILCTDELSTAGDPTDLVLDYTTSRSNTFGYDLIQVNVFMVDQNQVLVPGASSRIDFSLEGEGEIIGVCNSDYQSLEPCKVDYRKLYDGRCIAIIKTKDKSQLKFEAYATELDKSYTLTF